MDIKQKFARNAAPNSYIEPAPLASTLIKRIFAVYFVLACSITTIQVGLAYHNAAQQVLDDLDVTATTFSPGVSLAAWNYDEEQINSVVKGILKSSVIVRVEVEDLYTQLHIQLTKPNFDSKHINIRKEYKLTYGNGQGKVQTIGKIILYSSHDIVVKRVSYDLMVIIIMAILKTMGLGLIILFFAKKLIAMPLQEFTNKISKIDKEQVSQLESGTIKHKELAYLYDAFNSLIKELFQKRQELAEFANDLEQRVVSRTAELNEKNLVLEQEIIERKKAESELERVQNDLVLAARQAGMTEITTNVLHNVGNMLNSVNVSAAMASDKLNAMNIQRINKTVTLLEQHQNDLVNFFASDEKGKLLPVFLKTLADNLDSDKAYISAELQDLTKRISEISHIIKTQQQHAKTSSIALPIDVKIIVEDALHINSQLIKTHQIQIAKNFDDIPILKLDKIRVFQIVVNLVSNAIHAMSEMPVESRLLTLGLVLQPTQLEIHVQDSGIGIPEENLTRIFFHGFTTRADGHGFGLHSCINAANEMGGQLKVFSAGPNQGAHFTLIIPV